MARFTSKKYPELVVKFSDGSRVKFTKREAEVDGDLADRLADFAQRHPDYEIEQAESDSADEKPLTPKQRAAARAEELGLDTSGTQKDIEARIAAFEAAADPETDDDEDPENEAEGAEDEDDSDDEDSDEDSDANTSDDA